MSAPRRVEVRLAPDAFLDPDRFRRACARAAGVSPQKVAELRLRRRAVDARGGRVRICGMVDVYLGPPPPEAPPSPRPLAALRGPPAVVVVGAGPCGLFCAWELAALGVRPVVLERGAPIRRRRKDVADLSARGILHPESNYGFGEGGAGTFSDGKLYTRAKKRGDVRAVLSELVACGAPERILVDARPHIGTNRLPRVVAAFRAHLEAAGVEVRFGARVEGLRVRDDRVCGVRVDGADLGASAVVLATGHSARDVYRFVQEAGAPIERKDFAMGVRIEHPQEVVDRMQYGAYAGHPALGAAAYRIAAPAGDGRSAYSFCMCPGGHIVPATTTPDAVVVNGWSPSSRRGKFANAGFVVPVTEMDLVAAGLSPADPLAGLAFQRRVEEAAYAAGGGGFRAPAQRVADFLAGRATTKAPETSYPRGVRPTDLAPVLGPLAAPLRRALSQLARTLPWFTADPAVMVGVESRTSAPVRIPRDPRTRQHPAMRGLFPAGEGAGYAGGIVSAALDGIATARAVAGALGGLTAE